MKHDSFRIASRRYQIIRSADFCESISVKPASDPDEEEAAHEDE
jgi:hypothetical protein